MKNKKISAMILNVGKQVRWYSPDQGLVSKASFLMRPFFLESWLPRVLAVLVSALFVSSAQATIVYNNFGSGMSFDISNGQGVGSLSNAEYGLLFTPSESGYMSSLTFAVSSYSGAGDITFSLYDNNLGQPGSVLETLSLAGLPNYGSSFTPQTITTSGATFLDAAQSYWLIASQPNSPDMAVWHNSTVAAETSTAFRDSTFTSWVPQSHEYQWALRVDVSQVPVPGAVVSSVLPTSRSVQVGDSATVFATVINTGPGTATDCSISPITAVSATFFYQTTDPATNALTGTPNTPVDIAEGAAQTFLFAFTPTAPFAPTDVQLSFDCTNTTPAATVSGLNTVLLSGSSSPVPDIIALATGTGILDLPASAGGNGAFAVATVNVGATGSITASADTGSATLPVTLTVCETNPLTGACINPTSPAATATTTIAGGGTPTFAFFATATGPIELDLANNRAFVSFADGGSTVRGSTSTALSSDVSGLPDTFGVCETGDSGWDDNLDQPLVFKSFAEYQAAYTSCMTASSRAFTTNDVAGKSFQITGDTGITTFNANQTGIFNDPGIETVPFTWFIDGFGYLVLDSSGAFAGLFRETMALVSISGSALSIKYYSEELDWPGSNMVRETGTDGEIWSSLMMPAP